MAQQTLLKSKTLEEDASNKNNSTNELIDRIGKNISGQSMDTHNTALKQMEDGLKNQSRLIDAQYEVNEDKNDSNKKASSDK